MMDDSAPLPGMAETLTDGLVRVLAPNPSPMTYWGTNTYVLGRETLVVVDPGPQDETHLAALLDHIGGRAVSHIIVTHSHLDHSPLARPLAQATGAPVIAFGDSDAGRSAVMQTLAASGLAGGGEGVDRSFAPDLNVSDGYVLTHPELALRVIHTPGHMGNHIALRWNDAILTGDHVMGWASSLVSPPDGDLTDFMVSIDRLLAEDATTLYPGHGAPITDPTARLHWLRDHRLSREAQIIAALTKPMDLTALTHAVYTDIAPKMLPAAARNVFAHLVDLHGRNIVDADPMLGMDAHFAQTTLR